MENKKTDNLQDSTRKSIVGKTFLIFSIALLVIAIFMVSGRGTSNTAKTVTGNSVSTYSGDAQAIKMHVENGRYILEPSTFKIGVPVRIEVDISRTSGCAKSIVIPAFDVRKIVTSNDNIIEFTPTKAGTFNIACSMNMYQGTFTVLEADGAKSNYVEAAPSASGGTCGGSGGGCGGCGG